MAPAAGRLHQLLAQNIKLAKYIYKQASHKLSPLVRQYGPQHALEPIPVRAARHPVHPIALLKQSKSRWFSTSARNASRGFLTVTKESTARGVKYDRSTFPKSRTGTAVTQLTGRAPFASTLRPNLTGGALGRTAGGYGLGSGRVGGARFFSHGPAPASEVIQNVSQAVRAFYLGGKKAQFDGHSQGTCGGKRWKAVSETQHQALSKMQSLPMQTPGSWVEFEVNPTITALTPLNHVVGAEDAKAAFCGSDAHLNSTGLLDVLSTDFSRTLKDLSAVLSDLQKLAGLGDLPITYCDSTTLRVHFPGCDSETAEIICEELAIKRGLVVQDELFDAYTGTEIALLFPFAPSKDASEDDAQSLFLTQQGAMEDSWGDKYSTQSEHSFEQLSPPPETNPWLSSDEDLSEGYGSLGTRWKSTKQQSTIASQHEPLEYQDFEGIYRFIEMCDNARA
ncbi:MAG: hypothetical protein Q9159_001523 [Coniocarpon cinnabarinum]